MRRAAMLAASAAVLALCAAEAGSAEGGKAARVGDTPLLPAVVTPVRTLPTASPELVALGRRLFTDTRLSQPQGTSCASCHDPAHAFSSDNGGRDGVAQGSVRGRLGTRNPPSLMYARYVPPLYFYQDDDSPSPQPFGGLFTDGRADTLAQQAREPLLAPHEMNNGSEAAAARRLARAGYREAFEALFGPGVLRQPRRAIDAFGEAMAAYLGSDELSPFSSRFDELLRGKPALTPMELRGLALFKDPDRGNCTSCHSMNDRSGNPARSLFTDFGYDAIAVPRNRALPSNRDPRHHDLGLCATAQQRHWPDSDSWCGYFRTPGLRNVAVRQRYMHNGVFTSLREAVAFYATRSTRPADWYRGGEIFDDLPAAMRGNVNVVSTPLNRRAGSTPALSEDDIDALVAFLKTLTDARYAPLIEAAPLKP